jgi:hypothetical protein
MKIGLFSQTESRDISAVERLAGGLVSLAIGITHVEVDK